MKAEKIVICFIAVAIGILVAGGAFYFYQKTKTIPQTQTKTPIIAAKPTPTPKPSIFLTVENPKDEEVFDQRTITISGKTEPNATIVITTDANDQIISPARNGSFSTTQTIENGQNRIEITAILENGEEITVTRTVTFSTEAF